MRFTRLLAASAATLTLIACSDNNDSFTATPPPPPLCEGSEIQPERLFLQQLGSDRVIIKWRGNAEDGAEATSVCWGTDAGQLLASSETDASVTATGHSEVLLEGLEPSTTYYYSVGGAAIAPADQHFTTAPEPGTATPDANVRIWIVGDSGVGGEGKTDSVDVMNGFLSYAEDNGGEPADLFLMLGDNAYDQGTDHEHQLAIFDVYTDLLKSTPLWPTIGNHEMGFFGISTSADPNSYQVLNADDDNQPDPAPDSPMPYLNIFTLPTDGETGGLPSGTEQYYAFDYGNVHVVSLDSQLSIRDEAQREAMKQWLIDDLSANTLDWTIVIFHHPPYTKGSHDSDNPLGEIDQPIFAIREEFTPIFEDYGVDLAYAGHSHVYERSFYIKDHTGLSDTFDPATMAELNDSGEPASGQGDEGYTQITQSGVDDKVVYTVAGNGGKATFVSTDYPHPANFYSQLIIGSVVLDITESTLDATFIDKDGNVLDSFIITR